MVGSIQNYKYVLSYNLLIALIFYGNDAMFSSRTYTMILIGYDSVVEKATTTATETRT